MFDSGPTSFSSPSGISIPGLLVNRLSFEGIPWGSVCLVWAIKSFILTNRRPLEISFFTVSTSKFLSKLCGSWSSHSTSAEEYSCRLGKEKTQSMHKVLLKGASQKMVPKRTQQEWNMDWGENSDHLVGGVRRSQATLLFFGSGPNPQAKLFSKQYWKKWLIIKKEKYIATLHCSLNKFQLD